MTPKQANVLSFIREYQRHAKGASPSYDEIRRHFGFRSKANVHRYVGCLVQRGYLEHDKYQSRELVVLT